MRNLTLEEKRTIAIEENKELIRGFVEEVYNKQDLETLWDFVDKSVSEDSIDHLRQFFTAFPDSHTTVLDLFAEGDKVVARRRINATNKGPFAGQPATGKKVQFDSIRIYRIDDNRIVESWAMQDRMGLMEQLGLIRAMGEVNWAAGEGD